MSSNRTVKKIRYALRWLPDRIYIQLNYLAHFHRFANLRNPKTYNEKLNWLKLHDHNPIYPEIVDKYTAKEYVERILGMGGYCIPTIGIWDRFDEIDFDSLPNQFVLKCTHDSEGIVIVKDKSQIDKAKIKQIISAALQQNFYYIGREWPYKSIKPRIIAEPFLTDNKTGELRDYKFFCFDGVPRALFVASDRSKDVRFDYFDMDFNHLDIQQKYPNSPISIEKPSRFDEMIDIARELSKDFSHVRVDLYEVNEKVYFGELTFYHFSGFMPFQPSEWDKIFGDWLKLSL